jgi:APA family basic amino acid/polyamine antiporter
VVLWALTWFANRALRAKRTYIRDPEELGEREGTVN